MLDFEEDSYYAAIETAEQARAALSAAREKYKHALMRVKSYEALLGTVCLVRAEVEPHEVFKTVILDEWAA